MSILINGAKLPKSCFGCHLFKLDDKDLWCIANHYAGYCRVLSKYIDENKFVNERHPNCPLIEVKTPHGRLIDADALMTELMDSDLDHLQRDDWREVIQIVADAPTVTPESHWIPVTEDTLPEENRVVVVCGEKGTWDFGTYRGHGNNIHYWHWKKNTFKRVYWWMYKEDALPEPYKGVTE